LVHGRRKKSIRLSGTVVLNGGFFEAAGARLQAAHGLAGVGLLVPAAEAGRGVPEAAVHGATASHHVGVDGAGHAVLQLEVELRDLVHFVDGSFLHITLGSRLDHVAHLESLHSLVLGDAAGAVGAAHRHHMATALAVLATVSAFLSHLK